MPSRNALTGLLSRAFYIVRYRFFLFAGVLPYLLGTAIAYHKHHLFDPVNFAVALLGVGFSVAGVETFNEYFDSKFGGDFIFAETKRGRLPASVLLAGIFSFLAAFLTGVYLAFDCGLFVMWLAVIGFACAAFYVGPPVRWAYIGLGEIVIFAAYGPAMTLGGYYVQAKEFHPDVLLASMVPGFLVFAVAIMNEVPDYYQDRLVGKKTIVVRIGRERALTVYAAAMLLSYVFLVAGITAGSFPVLSSVALLSLPFVLGGYFLARKRLEEMPKFIHAMRITLLAYAFNLLVLAASFAWCA